MHGSMFLVESYVFAREVGYGLYVEPGVKVLKWKERERAKERKQNGERRVGRRGRVKCRCVALREAIITRKEIFLRKLELRGREEEIENGVDVVSQDQNWTKEMRAL